MNLDEADWKKLRRLLGYLKRTIKLPLILQVDGVNVIEWWMDASYAAHNVIQVHTGGTMAMGKDGRGLIISISKRQKINTKSLTEAELIRTNDMMPQMLCTRYFLESQGYGINENIMYQDNMSAMLLVKNGKKSSTKNTKHINVRYYFIKDWVETRDVMIEHCPTEEFLRGHFKKPLQGALFRKFRA